MSASYVGPSRIARFALDAALCAGVAAFAWLVVEPRLVYYWQGPALYFTPEFVDSVLWTPGGPADFLARLVAQLYADNALGAAAIAVLAAITLLASRAVLRRIGVTWRPAAYLPVLAMVLVIGRYDHRVTALVATPVTLAIAAIYLWAVERPAWLRATMAALLMTAAVLLCGGYGLVVPVLAGVAELGRRRWIMGAVLLAASAACVAVVLTAESRGYLLPLHIWLGRPWNVSRWMALALPAVLPVAAAIGLILKAAAGHLRARSAQPPQQQAERAAEADRDASPERPRRHPIPRGVAEAAAVVLVAMVFMIVARSELLLAKDEPRKRLLVEAAAGCAQDWPAVLATVEGLPQNEFSDMVRLDVFRALQAQGLLGERMFHYPQPSRRIIASWHLDTEDWGYMWRCIDLWLDAGRVYDAQHVASEALNLLGPRADLLKRLAMIHMVKNEPRPARAYLLLLSRHVWMRPWAIEWLDRLDRDPSLAGEPQIAQLRKRMMIEDDSLQPYVPPLSFAFGRLVERDPSNRLALDFAVANYLLHEHIAGFLRCLPVLDPSGQGPLPTHYQEALCLAESESGPTKWSARIRPEVAQRFREFKAVATRATDRAAAKAALASQFGDTYFYYAAFGQDEEAP